MFGVGGHTYIYLRFRLHSMLNIVADNEGVGAAVLLRSYSPVSEIGQALAISVDWSNHPLFEPGGLGVLDGPEPEKSLMGPRDGIDYALPEHVNA
ncbi:hypothetical protein OROGR_033215 [Orobanche gracilis]